MPAILNNLTLPIKRKLYSLQNGGVWDGVNEMPLAEVEELVKELIEGKHLNLKGVNLKEKGFKVGEFLNNVAKMWRSEYSVIAEKKDGEILFSRVPFGKFSPAKSSGPAKSPAKE